MKAERHLSPKSRRLCIYMHFNYPDLPQKCYDIIRIVNLFQMPIPSLPLVCSPNTQLLRALWYYHNSLSHLAIEIHSAAWNLDHRALMLPLAWLTGPEGRTIESRAVQDGLQYIHIPRIWVWEPWPCSLWTGEENSRLGSQLVPRRSGHWGFSGPGWCLLAASWTWAWDWALGCCTLPQCSPVSNGKDTPKARFNWVHGLRQLG